jgi:hypothetical protein
MQRLIRGKKDLGGRETYLQDPTVAVKTLL